jgi:hypothetical protein
MCVGVIVHVMRAAPSNVAVVSACKIAFCRSSVAASAAVCACFLKYSASIAHLPSSHGAAVAVRAAAAVV